MSPNSTAGNAAANHHDGPAKSGVKFVKEKADSTAAQIRNQNPSYIR